MQSDSKVKGAVGVTAPRFSAEIDAELFNRAEKELAAFVAAVDTLHGEEEARAAADDWLLELTTLKEPCKGASLDLRSVTIGAAMRLARRLSIPWLAHAVLAVIAGILLLAAPARALAVDSNSRHLVTQNKSAPLVVFVGRRSLRNMNFSKIPTMRAKTRTTPYAMCGLLTGVNRGQFNRSEPIQQRR
jgi:hypothetical protein